jgi:DNA-binding CsgD family transcriptional regulator
VYAAALLSRLRERTSRWGTLARLAIVGALVALLTAGAVATWIESRITELLLAQVAARAKDQVQLGILTNVRTADFELPYSVEKRADLAARLDPLLARARQSDSGIIRLNLFASDGTILYSDMANLRGQMVSPVANELLANALAGSPGTEISTLSGTENADLRPRYTQALEAYIPFTLDTRVVGVYEFYEDLAPIEPVRPLVWGSVAVSSAVVFVSLLLVFSSILRNTPEMPTPPAPPADARVRTSIATTMNREGHATVQPLLTRREAEVLRLMADGLTYPQIAARLVVDEETVRSHAKRVLRKLGESSRANAVLAARRAGLL